MENNIHFIGAEPLDAEILRKIKEHGYTDKDLLGFYFVRVIPQWKRQGRNFKNIEKDFKEYIARTSHNCGIKTAFTYHEFLVWYQKNQGTKSDFNPIDEEN